MVLVVRRQLEGWRHNYNMLVVRFQQVSPIDAHDFRALDH